MLGVNAPAEHESRLEWWRRQVSRQQSAGISVAEFCRQLGVTVRAFTYWRDRVQHAFRIKSSYAADSSAQRLRVSAADAAPGFMPVSIVSSGMTAELEIDLANGRAIRLKGSLDPGLVQAAIVAAAQFSTSSRGRP
jgi:hypothetical protein